MPTYIVSLKDDASPEQIKEAKDLAISQGGEIKHEYSLIKAFSVSYPEGSVATLDSNENVKAVELDGTVTTQ